MLYHADPNEAMNSPATSNELVAINQRNRLAKAVSSLNFMGNKVTPLTTLEMNILQNHIDRIVPELFVIRVFGLAITRSVLSFSSTAALLGSVLRILLNN